MSEQFRQAGIGRNPVQRGFRPSALLGDRARRRHEARALDAKRKVLRVTTPQPAEADDADANRLRQWRGPLAKS